MPVSADIDGTRIILDSQYQHQDRIKNIPGAHKDKITEKWSVPLTWSAAVALRKDFGADFAASDALNEWGYKELETRIAPLRELRTRLDLDGFDPTNTIANTARDIGDAVGLKPHQIAGVAFAATARQALILDEQGTGKTAQTIAALHALQRSGENVFPVLVVAPSSVKRVWEREFNRWYPGLTVANVKGSAAQRRKKLETPAHVYIMSYSNMPRHSKLGHSPGAPAIKRCVDCGGYDPDLKDDKCQAHTRELNQIGFRTVVVDEAHRATSPKSTWTRSIWSISDLAEFRFALTGTPVTQNITSFWALLRFASPLEFPVKQKFIERFAEIGYNAWGAVEVGDMRADRIEEFAAITQPFYRRVLKKIVLPFLPPVYEERRLITFTGAQAKAYRDMEKKMMAELDGSTTPLVETSPLHKANRLLQLASTYLEVIDDEVDDADLHSDESPPSVALRMPSNKITAFIDDIANGDYWQTSAGVVVFSQSRQMLELLAAELTARKLEFGMVTGSQSEDERNQAIDDFQDGVHKYILVSIAAGGAGLTLTAADTMVFLQRSWSSVDMQQAYARADRLGSEIHQSIRIIHYITEGTVEEGQLDALADKDHKAEEILRDNASLLAWMKDEKGKK